MVDSKKEPEYKHPESYGDSEMHSMASKDKRMKALYGRYEDVPNAEPEAKVWENSQGNKHKGTYRTMDDIEKKAQKSYDMVIGNSIKFIKTDLLTKAMKLQKIQE